MATTEYNEEAFNDLTDYFYGAPIALNMTGPDGAIERTNLAELKLLGYDAEQYVGRHLAEFHSDPEAVQSLFDRLAAGEKIVEHETTLVRRDGTTQKVLLYANARIEDGRFRGIRCFTFPHPDDLRPDIAEVGALRDLSLNGGGEQMTPEEREELYQELRDFFENGPVNLHIVGGDGLIKHANKSEVSAMGYEPETYIGQHIARFHADAAVIDGMLEDLVGGTPLINFSATLYHRDGSKMPVMIYSNSRMREGSFVNTRCFTVAVPKSRPGAQRPETFAWPRNEDFGFTIPGREAPKQQSNPMTLALKYIASRKRPEESLGLLARVSEILGGTRTYEQMFGDVAKLTVPFLADYTSIDLDSGHVAHAGTEESQLRTAGIHDPLIVPLSIRGTRVGALTLLRENTPARRNFGPADRALAEELARRIAFAIELATLTPRA